MGEKEHTTAQRDCEMFVVDKTSRLKEQRMLSSETALYIKKPRGRPPSLHPSPFQFFSLCEAQKENILQRGWKKESKKERKTVIIYLIL